MNKMERLHHRRGKPSQDRDSRHPMAKIVLTPHNMRHGKPTVPLGAGVLKLDGTVPKLIIMTGAVLKTGNPKQTGLPYRFPSATPEPSS